MAAYYGKLKKLWDELQEIEGIPVCECGAMNHCTCLLLKKMLEREYKNRVMQFLMGLNDSYEHVRTNKLSTDPLPTVNKVFHTVMQIERQKDITGLGNNQQDSVALNANRQSQYRQGDGKKEFKKDKADKSHLKCYHCNAKGHTKDSCFKIIGYPDWYKGPREKTQ